VLRIAQFPGAIMIMMVIWILSLQGMITQIISVKFIGMIQGHLQTYTLVLPVLQIAQFPGAIMMMMMI